MKVYFVDSEFQEMYFGPFLDQKMLKVLKIVQMSQDESAELIIHDSDPYGDQLQEGLLPFEISVSLLSGKIQDKEIKLIWPPRESEGKFFENDGLVQYFCWARSNNDAIKRIATFGRAS